MSEQVVKTQNNDNTNQITGRDRIKSPDNLNEYIKIATPGMWMGLLAILTFTVGMVFWCIFAKLETRENSAVVVKDGAAKCYLDENMQSYSNDSMTIRIENEVYNLGEHGREMEKLTMDNDSDESLLYLMGKSNPGWYYIYEIEDVNLKDGVYKGVIVIDSVKPISFIINRK